jgi:hypothetical protein
MQQLQADDHRFRTVKPLELALGSKPEFRDQFSHMPLKVNENNHFEEISSGGRENSIS